MICISTIIFVLLFFASSQDVLSFDLLVEPTHLRVGPRDNVTIMCQANLRFSDCQFTWWDVDELAEGPHFDFKDGLGSKRTLLEGDNVNYHLAGYEYAGSGLENGQCGIRLFGVMLRYRLISCRVRTLGGSWNYGYMSLCSHSANAIDLNFEPEKPIVRPGESVKFLGTLKDPSSKRLLKCTFQPEKMKKIIFNANNTQNTDRCTGTKTRCREPNTPRVVVPENASSLDNRTSYFGNGFENGQCGLTIQRITEQENGWLYFEAQAEDGGFDRRVVHLTVASPPKGQFLTITNQRPAENEEVTATCWVQASRPVSSIKWVIGEEVLREDKMDDTPAQNYGNSTWQWDHESKPIRQTLVFTMKREYNRQDLECIVSHFALPNPKRIRKPLTLTREIIDLPNEHIFEEARPAEVPVRLGRVSCPRLIYGDGVALSCKRMKSINCTGTLYVGTQVSPVCKQGFSVVSGTLNRISCLAGGNWSGSLPQCRPTGPVSTLRCPALSATRGLTLVCKNGGQLVNCNRPMSYGTEVDMDPQCNSGYTLMQDPGYRKIKCLDTGEWDKRILECKEAPGCGISRKLVERPPSTVNKPAGYGEFPWHVGIYKITSRGYEQICGGTLIAMDTVITAASCFWKDRYDENFDKSLYKVVAGKIRRSWNTTEEHAQIRDVEDAKAPERYSGRDSSYQVNLAKLTLSSPMLYSDYVNVVCVDWNSQRERAQLKSGQKAYVPGWAFAEEERPGETLSSVTMPFITYEDCNDELTPDLKRLFTGDKFCAGSTQVNNGFTMCDSDHGSGLVFYNAKLGTYDFRGVTSVPFKPITNRETCYASRFGAFTLFSMFTNWVQTNEL